MCKEISKALCMPQNDYFTCFFVISQIPRPNVKAKSSQSHIFFFYFKGEQGFSEKVRKTPFFIGYELRVCQQFLFSQ